MLGESVAEPQACFADICLVALFADDGVDEVARLACEPILDDERGSGEGYSAGLDDVSTRITASTTTLDCAKMTLDLGL